jgi:hypothetical protein
LDPKGSIRTITGGFETTSIHSIPTDDRCYWHWSEFAALYRRQRILNLAERLSWNRIEQRALGTLDLQSQNALGQARLLIGPERVNRVDPMLKRPIALDDWSRARAELPAEAERAQIDCAARIAERFLDAPARCAEFFWPPAAVSASGLAALPAK